MYAMVKKKKGKNKDKRYCLELIWVVWKKSCFYSSENIKHLYVLITSKSFHQHILPTRKHEWLAKYMTNSLQRWISILQKKLLNNSNSSEHWNSNAVGYPSGMPRSKFHFNFATNEQNLILSFKRNYWRLLLEEIIYC